MGTLFFLHNYPKEYRRVVEGRAKGISGIIDAERRVFGTDHCEVGSLLASRWRLPEYIPTAISDHHNMSPGRRPQSDPAGLSGWRPSWSIRV